MNHLHVIDNNYNWHRGSSQRNDSDSNPNKNITLVQLPPYSPELNPMENLWNYLKSHFWSNRAYDSYEALEQAAMKTWRIAVLSPGLMKTVCAAPYLERASSN